MANQCDLVVFKEHVSDTPKSMKHKNQYEILCAENTYAHLKIGPCAAIVHYVLFKPQTTFRFQIMRIGC